MTRKASKALAPRPAGGITNLDRVEDPIVVGSDGSIRIDTARVMVPQNVYDADYLWAKRRKGAVSLFFGKGDLHDEGKLRSRLELRYPYEGFYHHLWKNSREFHTKLKDFLASKLEADEDRPDPSRMQSQKDHSDWVNVDYIAHSGTHACLDFFNLSLPGLARFARGAGSAGLTLTPVVRVQTTARELLRLLDQCGDIIAELKADGFVEANDEKPSA